MERSKARHSGNIWRDFHLRFDNLNVSCFQSEPPFPPIKENLALPWIPKAVSWLEREKKKGREKEQQSSQPQKKNSTDENENSQE